LDFPRTEEFPSIHWIFGCRGRKEVTVLYEEFRNCTWTKRTMDSFERKSWRQYEVFTSRRIFRLI
jgi:hypothetical protein